jgi:hypothetical protein
MDGRRDRCLANSNSFANHSSRGIRDGIFQDSENIATSRLPRAATRIVDEGVVCKTGRLLRAINSGGPLKSGLMVGWPRSCALSLGQLATFSTLHLGHLGITRGLQSTFMWLERKTVCSFGCPWLSTICPDLARQSLSDLTYRLERIWPCLSAAEGIPARHDRQPGS